MTMTSKEGRNSLTTARSCGHGSDKMRLLIVLGEGGHTKQLLNLVDLLGDVYDYRYVISKEDNLSASHIRYPGPIYRLTRPRGKSTERLGAILRTILAGIQSLWVLLRVHPAAILSAGPAIAVPVSVVGKLLGTRIIFVESSSRVKALSLTGRIMYRWADLFFVQWPQLRENLPRAIYAGRLV
jgi:beta-1,4-N-acetylglucosaminyltransferase